MEITPTTYIVLVGTLSILAYFLLRLLKKIFHKKNKGDSFLLKRYHANPLVSPQEHNDWEACGVFNPAAYKDDDGVVHLLYRAIGNDGVSRVGYLKSNDGFSIDERISYPIFFLENIREHDIHFRYDPILFPSGGSWGGAEDPRLVKIEDTIYLTFNAFDGWDFIRIGVSSIKEEDFLAQRWNWSKTLLISPQGEINKNWVLFPQKINGRFAILHSISPHIQIDYVENLEDLAKGKEKITSVFSQEQNRKEWDYKLRGAGCPPVKTDKGWLVLYHATEKHEPHKYKIGAMLLDLEDPQKIIARSPAPLLAPDCWYENDGKPGVVYVCGAVLKDEQLLIYYGGGDKHTCVAETNINDLLSWMISTEK